MKPYDGVLICSDFDGTLFYGGEIPKNNLEAIREFEEKGGRFTLCTGRFPSILADKKLSLTLHTPMICLNGAVLYDHEAQSILFEGHTDGTAMLPALQSLHKEWGDRIDRLVAFPIHSFQSEKLIFPYSEDDLRRFVSRPLYKLVIVTTQAEEEAQTKQISHGLCQRLTELLGIDYMVGRSWNVGTEVQEARFGKGVTARKLANRLGADTLICVGDYENDLPMLREADRAFTVENGVESAKQLAEAVLCHAKDGAIADLISRL